MRGLTPSEREYLELKEDDFPESWLGVAHALIARGLVAIDETPWEINYRNTELGRLALRVCPVGEP